MPHLVRTAKLFCCRPSSLLAIQDPWIALAFDLAAAPMAAEAEREAASETERRVIERICL